MRVGIDFHGTADTHPSYFLDVMRQLRQAGHSVGIVTATPNWSRAALLKQWQALGLPDPDFVIMKTGVEQTIPNIAWKHLVMRRNHIDLLFDDLDTGEVRLIERV